MFAMANIDLAIVGVSLGIYATCIFFTFWIVERRLSGLARKSGSTEMRLLNLERVVNRLTHRAGIQPSTIGGESDHEA